MRDKRHSSEIIIPGLKVGHAQDYEAMTGLTVFLFDRRVAAAGRLSGRATSTRQADSMNPGHIVGEVDAFLFTGGSAFGLDATGGVLAYLEERGRGFYTRYGLVPGCPTAALFDLALGDPKTRPTRETALDACRNASREATPTGSVGVGTGASVGKFHGIERAMKGGFGTAFMSKDALRIQAFAGVNGFGDVLDIDTGEILAGLRKGNGSLELADTEMAVAAGEMPKGFIPPKAENTILAAVITNADLKKPELFSLAEHAEQGLRRAVRPALTPVDGDVVFCAGTAEVEVPVESFSNLAAECVARAIMNAVRTADGFGVIPACADLAKR